MLVMAPVVDKVRAAVTAQGVATDRPVAVAAVTAVRVAEPARGALPEGAALLARLAALVRVARRKVAALRASAAAVGSAVPGGPVPARGTIAAVHHRVTHVRRATFVDVPLVGMQGTVTLPGPGLRAMNPVRRQTAGLLRVASAPAVAVMAAQTSATGEPGRTRAPAEGASRLLVVRARPSVLSVSAMARGVGLSIAAPPGVLHRVGGRLRDVVRPAEVGTTLVLTVAPRAVHRTGGSPVVQVRVHSATPATGVRLLVIPRSAQTDRLALPTHAVAGMTDRLAPAAPPLPTATPVGTDPVTPVRRVPPRAVRPAVATVTDPDARPVSRTAIGVPTGIAAPPVAVLLRSVLRLGAPPATGTHLVGGLSDLHRSGATRVPRADRAVAGGTKRSTMSRRADRDRPEALISRFPLTPTRSCLTRQSDRSCGR